jgi:alpha-tubulin suppressor-like RCC1 family protein
MRHRRFALILVFILTLAALVSLGAHASVTPSGSIWAWGGNTYGQLGNNSLSNSSLPVQTLDPVTANYLAGVTTIAAGYDHNLALKSDGTVRAWGNNAWGQLGNNTFKSSSVPVQIVDPSDPSGFLTHVIAIAAGTSFSLALKSDGTVRAWGYNGKGQLGNNSSNSSSVPVQVRDLSNPSGYLTQVTAIAAGEGNSLALKSDGTVRAWGYNGFGGLGNGTVATLPPYSSNIPVQVMDPSDSSGHLTHVTAIAEGGGYSLALKSDGTVRAWGGNGYGNLGNNTFNNSCDLPVQVVDPSDPSGYLTHVTALAAGDYHSLALKSDGTVRAWGDSTYGELGYNSLNRSSIPVQVVDPSDSSGYLTHVSAIAAGDYHSLALKSDGTVRAWGYNNFGQLSNNSTTNSSLPVQVLDPTAPSQPLTNVTAITAGYEFSLVMVHYANSFDLNGDGSPDLLFQNQTTGALSYWLLNGAAPITTGTIPGSSNPLWQIVAVADLNGDGHPDLIWQNQATGVVVYWLMNGTTKIGSGTISGSSNPLLKVVAVADLNGDGHPDLIFQNQATGMVVYWLMNGTTEIGSGTISGAFTPVWKVVGVVDLDGDGYPDLIFQNQTTAAISYWLMKGTAQNSSGTIPGSANPLWQIIGAADLNRDGHPDLFFQNQATGVVVYWLMNGTTKIGSGTISGAFSPVWKVMGMH